MARPRCSVTVIAGLTHANKGVALLEHPAGYVNAKDVFESLDASSGRYHRKSFDFWMGGRHIQDRFHGFKKSYEGGDYVWDYVFKNIAEKERFYGFLCNPKPDNPAYQLCVLTGYAQKKENAQDMAELDRVERMRTDPDVLDALRDPRLFSEGEGKNYDE
jgi:hypothetical protein